MEEMGIHLEFSITKAFVVMCWILLLADRVRVHDKCPMDNTGCFDGSLTLQ